MANTLVSSDTSLPGTQLPFPSFNNFSSFNQPRNQYNANGLFSHQSNTGSTGFQFHSPNQPPLHTNPNGPLNSGFGYGQNGFNSNPTTLFPNPNLANAPSCNPCTNSAFQYWPNNTTPKQTAAQQCQTEIPKLDTCYEYLSQSNPLKRSASHSNVNSPPLVEIQELDDDSMSMWPLENKKLKVEQNECKVVVPSGHFNWPSSTPERRGTKRPHS